MAKTSVKASKKKRKKKVVPYPAKASKKKRKKRVPPHCKEVPEEIEGLGTYFDVLSSMLKEGVTFWFRGNANLTWPLTPSALRYTRPSLRNKALDLLSDFKRFGEIKLKKPPAPDDELKWVQIAQHNGLPTRLLDWTGNAAVALYFACHKAKDKKGKLMDGAVYILNPIDLNKAVDAKYDRVLDHNSHEELIKKYLKLEGEKDPDGLRTIAINPIWNSERIMLQQGVFTLHGSKLFTLNDKQASSLVYLRIKQKHKNDLRRELERVGINEMTLFPEAEHTCSYLKWREKLL